jgi:predicted nucleic acid-binding protein
MIILDTNVISALMRSRHEAHIDAWFARQPLASIWITAISVFEVESGIERLAGGRRRDALRQAFRGIVDEVLQQRVLAFDQQAARAAAVFDAVRKQGGRPVELRDVLIAGLVTVRAATLVTRNGRDFAGTGIRVVDPWSTDAPG